MNSHATVDALQSVGGEVFGPLINQAYEQASGHKELKEENKVAFQDDMASHEMATTKLIRRPTLFMDKLNEKRAEIDQRNRQVQQQNVDQAEKKSVKIKGR